MINHPTQLQGIGIVLIPIYILLCIVAIFYMHEFFAQLIKPEDYKPYSEEQMVLGESPPSIPIDDVQKGKCVSVQVLASASASSS